MPTADLTWYDSEWTDDPGDGAYTIHRGIYAQITLDRGTTPGRPWSWMVRPESSRCEYPEMYDLGWSRTLSAAKRAAAKALAKADASYGHVTY